MSPVLPVHNRSVRLFQQVHKSFRLPALPEISLASFADDVQSVTTVLPSVSVMRSTAPRASFRRYPSSKRLPASTSPILWRYRRCYLSSASSLFRRFLPSSISVSATSQYRSSDLHLLRFRQNQRLYVRLEGSPCCKCFRITAEAVCVRICTVIVQRSQMSPNTVQLPPFSCTI